MKGVCSEMRSKSSMVSGILSSCAMAMRWRTALVLPPDAATAAMAFSMDLRVRMSLGLTPRRARSMTMRPAAREASCFSADMAGTPEIIMGEIPRNSPAIAMVLAVNWPPQAAGAGAGGGFESFELVVVGLLARGGVRAHAFEDAAEDAGDFLVGAVGLLEVAGGDRCIRRRA